MSTDPRISSGAPELSVVVCTRDRADTLAICLDALLSDAMGPGVGEVVVVDNGSTDQTRTVAESRAGGALPLRYVSEPVPGLPHARNAGWKAARGVIVFFLDDDAVARPGCFRHVLNAYARYWDGSAPIAVGVRVCAGRPPGGSYPRWLDDRYRPYLTQLDLGKDTRKLHESESLVGAGFSVPRAVLQELGGFNVHLGAYGMDERWIEERVRSAGGSLVYCGEGVVDHPISPGRLNVSWFLRRLVLEGTSWKLMQWQLGRLSRRVMLHTGVRHLIAAGFHALRACVLILGFRQRAAFAASCRSAFCWGCVRAQLSIARGAVPGPVDER